MVWSMLTLWSCSVRAVQYVQCVLSMVMYLYGNCTALVPSVRLMRLYSMLKSWLISLQPSYIRSFVMCESSLI